MVKPQSNDIKDYPTVGLLFPSNYLSADDLRGREVTVVIVSIEPRHELKRANGKDHKPVVRLATPKGRPIDKRWVLNKTNAKIIAKIYDTTEVLDWYGKPITLRSEKVNAFGEVVDAIRVKPVVPNVHMETRSAPPEQPPAEPEPPPVDDGMPPFPEDLRNTQPPADDPPF